MNFIRTEIPDVVICEPTVHGDDRGYFVETFREDKLEEFLGYKINFCQDNESLMLALKMGKIPYQGEEGIHLFHLPYQNPIPIRVTLEKETGRKKADLNSVIRVYDHPNTLTDFRTNFTNATNITAEEFSLLIYAGLSKNLRKSLTLNR